MKGVQLKVADGKRTFLHKIQHDGTNPRIHTTPLTPLSQAAKKPTATCTTTPPHYAPGKPAAQSGWDLADRALKRLLSVLK